MDLIAALALVLVLEGLALAIMARSLPELLLSVREISPQALRYSGLALAVAGGTLYVLVRGV